MTAVRGMVATWPGRILAMVLGLAVVAGAVMIARGGTTPAKVEYRTAEVTRASVSQTVAISGSVNPSGTARLNFRSSGRLASILVTVGQQVQAGQALATIEDTDLQNALANAKSSLANAETSLQKQIQSQSDAARSLETARSNAASDLAAAQQAFAKIQSNYGTAKTNYQSQTSGAWSDITSFQSGLDPLGTQLDAAIADLQDSAQPDIKTAYNALFPSYASLANIKLNSTTVLASALDEYQRTRSAIVAAFTKFDQAIAAGADTTSAASDLAIAGPNYSLAVSRFQSALDTTSSGLSGMAANASSAQVSLNTAITKYITVFDKWRDDLSKLQAAITNEQQLVSTAKLRLTQATSSLATLTDAINGSYSSAQQNIQTVSDRGQQSIQTAQTTLAQKPLDIQTAQNSVATAQLSVQTAQTNLDNATLRAPSAGVVQAINGTVGEPASSSTTTPVVLLANTGTVQLHGTVGEADVAKLRLGLVANVTVDALGTGTRMTGKVTGLDPVATIQQGVPVYGIDISIDVPASSIKPGMSGTANVILASKQNVLTVPNLAIRTQGTRRYVQVLRDGQAVDVDATFGITNDTITEVTGGGLQEGDLVILPQARSGATTAPNRGIQQGPGGPGGIVIR
ncbi:MAG TPA: biotin/lipoyl-binding protein [Candidatus Limnocylindria bacterium]|nr:biotin/lipoyl-binding protein [Candidatus Limnocylindria bacterium]